MINQDLLTLADLRKRTEATIQDLLRQLVLNRKAVEAIATTIHLLRGASAEEVIDVDEPKEITPVPVSAVGPTRAPIVLAPATPSNVSALSSNFSLPEEIWKCHSKYNNQDITATLKEFHRQTEGKNFLLRTLSQFLVDRGLFGNLKATSLSTVVRRIAERSGLFEKAGAIGTYRAVYRNSASVITETVESQQVAA